MKNIYLVRHGEALDDINNTYGGWADDPLTERGVERAKELSKEILKLNPKKIFASPLRRARVTAEIIGKKLKIPVTIIKDLKERNRYGILTGVRMDLAKVKHPDLAEQVQDYDVTIEGAETYNHFKNRTVIALDKILKKNNEDILIVCHGGTFRIAMWELLGKHAFVGADLHAIIHIEEDKGRLILKTHKGLKFKKT